MTIEPSIIEWWYIWGTSTKSVLLTAPQPLIRLCYHLNFRMAMHTSFHHHHPLKKHVLYNSVLGSTLKDSHSTWHLQLKELSLYGYLVVFLFHDLLFLFYRWQRSSKRHGQMVASAAHPSPPCQHHCWLLLHCIGRWYVGLQLRVWNNIPSDRTQTSKSVWGWYGHFFLHDYVDNNLNIMCVQCSNPGLQMLLRLL